MAKRDIIVIGASAGGVLTLQTLVAGLPAEFQASIFIVLHLAPYSDTQLPEILNRAGRLPVVQARNDEPFERGHIYVAPPDRHLLLRKGKTILEAGPRENFNRPAIDPLFRSAARTYGERVIGILLSGLLDDGTAGMQEIFERGGVVIVQDPEEALYRDMPANALSNVNAHHVLSVKKMPGLLKSLIAEEVPEPAGESIAAASNEQTLPSVYSCPDCGGVLWELKDPRLVRFQCRVGHTYGPESLSARQSEDVERALWTALTSLEESASFSRKLAGRSWQMGDRRSALHYETKMHTAETNAAIIRGVLLQNTLEQPELESEESKEGS